MPLRRNRALLAAAAALALAIPAFSQEESPESLLPPGFGDPAALPPPVDAAPGPLPGQPAPAVPGASPPPSAAPQVESLGLQELSDAELEALIDALPKPIEIPDFARRPVDAVGPLDSEQWALGPAAWGDANGRYLSSLMRRLDAPIASRWTSILLRRALLTRTPAPALLNPVDWIAERAWLLLRMGEADGARMLVQAVDVDRFTPKMFTVGVQTALATADPAALCPLVDPGRETSDEAVWPLAEAMCAALEGDAGRASSLISRARSRSGLSPIDISLAEKIVGAGANTRRAVTIQWDDVDRLNSWRFGLASATGLEIPDRLMNGTGAHVRAWAARAPMVPIEQRVNAAQTAAALGVFSNQSLVGMHSLIADDTDPSEFGESIGGRLRLAYVAPSLETRLEAMRSLWQEARTPVDRRARRILTAAAAARIPPSAAVGADVDDLIASMLSAGHDRRAARWSAVVEDMEGPDAARAAALLAVASPGLDSVNADIVSAFEGANQSDTHAAELLAAALAGLGRTDASADLGRETGWTRALDTAVERNQPGTVALLAAIGLQTGGWEGVPPSHLFHVTSALRRVGLEYYARMIAAEALSRL